MAAAGRPGHRPFCDPPEPTDYQSAPDGVPNKVAVITAKVLNKEVENNLIGDEFNQPVKYEIKVTKTFKGPGTHIHAISTVSSAVFCGVNLIKDKEYLIMTGPPLDGTLHINSCQFSQLWETLSNTQKNLLQHYGRGCDCKITPCYSLPCGFSYSQCWWTDFITPMSNDNQTRNYACVKGIDGSCAWQPGYPSFVTKFKY
ncbi:metalloproteinase inhibitor 2-like [Corythoichthys intestinalis]|uniref:metalloproteinase inhibitor 2-like n=1 Tax=Corythoichthys intestinalis TaxID=161448 RepID=UPI0025A603A7|nr:metalloproteinase inhibitor 2-like [Corythoichthys intestinalis]